jgi:hypothetical protein
LSKTKKAVAKASASAAVFAKTLACK